MNNDDFKKLIQPAQEVLDKIKTSGQIRKEYNDAINKNLTSITSSLAILKELETGIKMAKTKAEDAELLAAKAQKDGTEQLEKKVEELRKLHGEEVANLKTEKDGEV